MSKGLGAKGEEKENSRLICEGQRYEREHDYQRNRKKLLVAEVEYSPEEPYMRNGCALMVQDLAIPTLKESDKRSHGATEDF